MTQIEDPPRTLPPRRPRLAIMSLLPCLLGLLATGCRPNGTTGLEVLPKQFLLHPGEQIHYTVLERSEDREPRFAAHYEFATENPEIVRLIKPTGVFEAVGRGRTALVVRNSDFRKAIWVADIWGPGNARPYPAPMALLTTLFARRAGDAKAYDEAVVRSSIA